MRNKLFSLCFVIIMIFSLSLTGCGSNNNNNAATATDEPAATTAPETAAGEATAAPATEPAAAGGADISGKIIFLTNRTDMIGKEYDEYVKRFNEKYPNIKVEFEASQTDYNQQAKVRMASGELPDVMFVPNIPNSDLPKYFASLDDLGLNDQLTFKDFKSFDGQLYGITTGNSTSGIVYNKKPSPMPESPKFRRHGMNSSRPARSSKLKVSFRSLPTSKTNGRLMTGYMLFPA